MLMENEISVLLDKYLVCRYIHKIGINIFRSFIHIQVFNAGTKLIIDTKFIQLQNFESVTAISMRLLELFLVGIWLFMAIKAYFGC